MGAYLIANLRTHCRSAGRFSSRDDHSFGNVAERMQRRVCHQFSRRQPAYMDQASGPSDLADHEGLRAFSGAKGSAGLKPCPKCTNVLSGCKSADGHVNVSWILEWLHVANSRRLETNIEHVAGTTYHG